MACHCTNLSVVLGRIIDRLIDGIHYICIKVQIVMILSVNITAWEIYIETLSSLCQC